MGFIINFLFFLFNFLHKKRFIFFSRKIFRLSSKNLYARALERRVCFVSDFSKLMKL